MYGAEVMLFNLAKEQKRDGYAPVLLSASLPGEKTKAIETAFIDAGLAVKQWRMNAGFNRRQIRKIANWIETNDFTHVHSHGYKFNILLASMGKLSRSSDCLKIQKLSTIHGYTTAPLLSKMTAYRFLDKLSLFAIDKVALVNPNINKIWPFNCLESKLTYIPNGIEKTTNQEYSDFTRNNLIAIGRLAEEKNFGALLSSIENKNCNLDIAGLGPLENCLRDQAKSLLIQKRVKFLGYISSPSDLFASYSALVISSKTEGLPIVLLEAMRAGLPVITTRVGAIPNVLGEDYPYYIESPSSQHIADAINRFAKSSTNEKRLVSDNLRALFDSKYTASQMAKNYQKLYID